MVLYAIMRSLEFVFRYALVLVWFLLSSVLGVLAIPFLFGNLNFNRYWTRLVTWGVSRIMRIRVELQSAAPLESFQPCIYIGNHQDNLDMLIFGAIFPGRTIVIAKRELIWAPFFNIFYIAAGNIFLDRKKHRKALEGITSASQKIRDRGVSVMILPEGTRNRSGKGMLPFKKGAFHMAVEAGLPLVPLVASPVSRVVDHANKRIMPGVIRVQVLEPIPTKGLTRSDVDQLAQESRSRMLAAFDKMT